MVEFSDTMKDRFQGCLIGCALGDALGAPFEGYWSHQIPSGDLLLANYHEYEGYERGQYTDDTQLTLATVESIVECGGVDPSDIARRMTHLWKNYTVIGPGGACSMAAAAFLRHGDWTRCGAPVGQAGNGTAMRTAALGLHFIRDPDRLPTQVAAIARITHKDPRSIAGGVAIAKAAQLLASVEAIEPEPFCAAIAEATRAYEPDFASLIAALPNRLSEDRETALRSIAWAGLTNPAFDRLIITPFVVPTVLASLWMVLTHPSSWSTAVAETIRLGGDVDTLGAIVGALMGARLGLSAIPSRLVEGVVDSQRLQSVALDYLAASLDGPLPS